MALLKMSLTLEWRRRPQVGEANWKAVKGKPVLSESGLDRAPRQFSSAYRVVTAEGPGSAAAQ
jgi:hypothetical protein